MIIDKDFAGLADCGNYYKYDGKIVTTGILDIRVPLFVTGLIQAGESIEAREWIEVGESIEAGEWINAGGSINAGEWIKMYGIRTKTLKIITGMVQVIWILDTHIKIGCEMKTKEAWAQITEEQAKEMGDDGSIWAIRDALLLM
jgi:hypothetical protein